MTAKRGSRNAGSGTSRPYLPAASPTDFEKGFGVMVRLLGPTQSAVPGILNGTGWQPPAIMPGK